jgi:AcrR family transcriptional regulator
MATRVKTQTVRKGKRPSVPRIDGKTRRYDGSGRQAAAAQTRRAIVQAARQCFLERGYAATTMAAIAAAAGVSHETVYTAFGPKPVLYRHLIEIALSGTDEPVSALERESTLRLQAEPDPRRVLDELAHVVRQIHERLAPLFDVLRDGARTDSDLLALSNDLEQRRVGHMRALAADLAAKGGLRPGLSIEKAGDVFWGTISTEFYLLWVRGRGWSPDEFERWLADMWKRLLLPEAP